jgi:hypothetical protein
MGAVVALLVMIATMNAISRGSNLLTGMAVLGALIAFANILYISITQDDAQMAQQLMSTGTALQEQSEQMLAAISSFSMNKVAAFEGGQAHAHFEPRTRARATLRAVA